jgi:hypothetical protein
MKTTGANGQRPHPGIGIQKHCASSNRASKAFLLLPKHNSQPVEIHSGIKYHSFLNI